jgi:hypothetical protein
MTCAQRQTMSPETAPAETPLDIQLHAFLELGEACEDISRLVADAYEETLRRIVRRTMGDGPEADQALADGALVIQGRTVVMRLNPQTDFAELFCDIGQPAADRLEAVYRHALEVNLCRRFPGVTLGLHPESGRLVATLALNGLMVDHEDVCMTALELLARCACEIRESGVFELAD